MRQEQQNTTQKLIQENIKLTNELKVEIKKIKRWIALSRLLTVVKILIIVIPIVLAVIYLPPFLKPYFEKIQSFYQLSSQTAETVQEVTDFIEKK